MAAGIIFDILETIYLVKLLINITQFDLKFCGSHRDLLQILSMGMGPFCYPDITFHAHSWWDIGKNG